MHPQHTVAAISAATPSDSNKTAAAGKIILPDPNRSELSSAPARPRIIAPDPAGIPAELKELPRWVTWRLALRTNDKGDRKWTKEPVNPRTGGGASSTDPATWTTFDRAWRVYERSGGRLAGVGFVLGDGFVGVDLDHVRDPETGAIEDWARSIAERLATYTEVSVSGTGIHCIARGALPSGRRRRDRIEMYDGDRYFTITGLPVGAVAR